VFEAELLKLIHILQKNKQNYRINQLKNKIKKFINSNINFKFSIQLIMVIDYFPL